VCPLDDGGGVNESKRLRGILLRGQLAAAHGAAVSRATMGWTHSGTPFLVGESRFGVDEGRGTADEGRFDDGDGGGTVEVMLGFMAANDVDVTAERSCATAKAFFRSASLQKQEAKAEK
jgi:hypothetical protein